MTHTLYGASGCGSAMVEAALVRADMPYRLVHAASWEKGPGLEELAAAVVSRWSGARAHLRESRPAFSELLERIEKHPSVAEVFACHWAAATALA